MELSVVVATRNDPEVFDALESVMEQDYYDYEIIVVDGSDGGHQEDLETFCSDNDAITYLHESERDEPVDGLNGARNFGVANASGEGVALLDADCVATDGWLESFVEALEEDDIVECTVTYDGEGKNCPMDRVIQNDGKEYRFLGAGLAFRRAVWEETKFDERFHQLRNDTAFGFDALDNEFSYAFCEDAEVLHRAGRFSPLQFVKERLRFVYEPLFYGEYRKHDHFDDNVDHLGPLLYPKELLYLAALFASAVLPFAAATVPLLMGAGELVYLQREGEKRALDVCPRDLVLLFFLVPLALVAKRLAIWRGAVTYRTPVL
ncbi:MAG: glycosyltransferase family A protein [Candidatus Nanohaloarchaea archaeon]|nr:glycosyltransferase family A protein [Candidatus Nanohaloarchaea archaeon]